MADEELDEQTAGRSFWSGTITFGLVSIPVRFFAATRPSRVPIRMLSSGGTPLRRVYYDPETGRDLSAEEIVRGYEIEKGRYVIVTDQELERLAPEKTRDIDLRLFVPVEQIPPRYFERAYFLAPAGPSLKAYRLLAATMERTGRAGVATFVMRGKEYLVALLSERGVLRAETLRFADEIRTPEDIGLPERPKLPARAVAPFRAAIEKHRSEDLPRSEMKDETAARLLELVHEKRKHGEDVHRSAAAPEEAPVVDLLEVLRRSLAGAGATPRRPPQPAAASGDLGGLSRSELYDRAKKLNIPGRSAMSKEQLAEAIRKAA